MLSQHVGDCAQPPTCSGDICTAWAGSRRASVPHSAVFLLAGRARAYMYDMDRRSFLLALGAATAGSLVRPATLLAAPKPVIEQDFCIVLDPGHGGEATGAVGPATR